MTELEVEVRAQLKELNPPEKHAKLVKYLIVLTREQARRQKINDRYLVATAVANPDEGTICLIPDFRWDLAHEIGHLVWFKILTKEQRESFCTLFNRESEEILGLIMKVFGKFPSKMVSDVDPHSEKEEEVFAWHYAFYLLHEDYPRTYPKNCRWLRDNVFMDEEN
jgi:hypothetical protein